MVAGLILANLLSAAHPAQAATPGDSAIITDALNDQNLRLEMRGKGANVNARAHSEDGGCVTRIVASAPGGPRAWSRVLRWSELAWAGRTADGLTQMAFHDSEGHLATDMVAFPNAQPEAFDSALASLVQRCRKEQGETTRVTVSQSSRSRTCYLAAQPQIQIVARRGAAGLQPPRLMASLLSRENPRVEMQLFFQRDDGKPGPPEIAFVVAEPSMVATPLERAVFMIDGETYPARHTIAAYGTTRLRIAVSDEAMAGLFGFSEAMIAAEESTLELRGANDRLLERFHFAPASVLGPGLAQIAAGGWSCDAAKSAPPPAAAWALATE